jgi:hypothetical protein
MNPPTLAERGALVLELERKGLLDPACGECQRNLYPVEDLWRITYPWHRVRASCESGRRPHCTCEHCW